METGNKGVGSGIRGVGSGITSFHAFGIKCRDQKFGYKNAIRVEKNIPVTALLKGKYHGYFFTNLLIYIS